MSEKSEVSKVLCEISQDLNKPLVCEMVEIQLNQGLPVKISHFTANTKKWTITLQKTNLSQYSSQVLPSKSPSQWTTCSYSLSSSNSESISEDENCKIPPIAFPVKLGQKYFQEPFE